MGNNKKPKRRRTKQSALIPMPDWIKMLDKRREIRMKEYATQRRKATP